MATLWHVVLVALQSAGLSKAFEICRNGNETVTCQDRDGGIGFCCRPNSTDCCLDLWWRKWYFWVGSVVGVVLMTMCCKYVMSRRRKPLRYNSPTLDPPPQYDPSSYRTHISHIPMYFVSPSTQQNEEQKPEHSIDNLPSYEDVFKQVSSNSQYDNPPSDETTENDNPAYDETKEDDK